MIIQWGFNGDLDSIKKIFFNTTFKGFVFDFNPFFLEKEWILSFLDNSLPFLLVKHYKISSFVLLTLFFKIYFSIFPEFSKNIDYKNEKYAVKLVIDYF